MATFALCAGCRQKTACLVQALDVQKRPFLSVETEEILWDKPFQIFFAHPNQEELYLLAHCRILSASDKTLLEREFLLLQVQDLQNRHLIGFVFLSLPYCCFLSFGA